MRRIDLKGPGGAPPALDVAGWASRGVGDTTTFRGAAEVTNVILDGPYCEIHWRGCGHSGALVVPTEALLALMLMLARDIKRVV